MGKIIFKRLFFDACLVVSLAALPWYFTAVLTLAGILLFKDFWEAVFTGFLVDSFYSSKLPGLFYGRFGTAAMTAFLAFKLKEYAKVNIFLA